MKEKDLIIDSHAHLNFKDFKDDSQEVIERSLENNVWMINVGSQYETSKRAVEISKKNKKGVYAAVGFHPLHTTKIEEESEKNSELGFNYENYKKLALSKEVVAIGETGLDYYYKPKNKEKLIDFKNKQKKIFSQQLKLSQELKLPVILHCRMAHQDLLEILNSDLNQQRRGVIHCFTGNWKEAKEYLKMGFYIGFTGIIFKLDLKDVIEKVPLNRVLVETDCPYLTPPKREGRNEPLFVKDIVEEIARIKKIRYKEVADITTQNARKLFKI